MQRIVERQRKRMRREEREHWKQYWKQYREQQLEQHWEQHWEQYHQVQPRKRMSEDERRRHINARRAALVHMFPEKRERHRARDRERAVAERALFQALRELGWLDAEYNLRIPDDVAMPNVLAAQGMLHGMHDRSE